MIHHIAPKRSGHSIVGRMIQDWLPKEDYAAIEYNGSGLQLMMPKDDIIVIQTRDLLNWYASYYTLRKSHTRNIAQWKDLAQKPLGESRHVIYIEFDLFVEAMEYREAICADLGGFYNEKSIDTIPEAGGGSSFDGFKYKGMGSFMPVTRRYQQVDPKIFVHLFNEHPGLLEFYLGTLPSEDKISFLITWGIIKETYIH